MRTAFLNVWTAAIGNNAKDTFTGGLTALLGFVISFLGGWDQGLQILFLLMAADYATGVLGAFKTKTVNSDVMFWGGIRKITILFVVGLAAQVDGWLHLDAPVVRTAALYFYAGREGLSVVENLGVLGVPLPPAVLNFLEQLKQKGDVGK
jgi:toxin secretion/phage lysis holin